MIWANFRQSRWQTHLRNRARVFLNSPHTYLGESMILVVCLFFVFVFIGGCLCVCLFFCFWGVCSSLVCIHPWSDRSQSRSCWQSPASLRSPWRAPWMRIGSQWPSRPPGCYPGMSITPVSSEIKKKIIVVVFLHNLIEKIEYTCFNTSQHLNFFILLMKIFLCDVLHQNDLTFCQ